MNIMTVKKLTFCILCFANAANLATEEDFNNENSSNSKVEENINKNSWNTKKWGSIYILSTMYSISNMEYEKSFLYNGIENEFIRYLNILFSWAVEYKYIFNKNIGINVRLNLNNIDAQGYRFAFEPSIEWVYGRKGKKIFSGSFSPISFDFGSVDNYKSFVEGSWFLTFYLFKFEYNRLFYLNFGKIKIIPNFTINTSKDFFTNIFSIEIGLNILGIKDWRKNLKSKKENDLMNKNSLNTRKWGSIYLLFPHLSAANIIGKREDDVFFKWNYYLNLIFSFIVEYKYMFDENLGINVRLAINNAEFINNFPVFFSLTPSIEWIYGRKGKKIFSGSFSPLDLKMGKDYKGIKFDLVWSFIFLKYECNRNFYLNFGHIKNKWSDPFANIFYSFFLNIISIELGFNIVGMHDLRISKKNISVKL